jgi:hypothetical protein
MSLRYVGLSNRITESLQGVVDKAVIPDSIRDPWIADQVRNDSTGAMTARGAIKDIRY